MFPTERKELCSAHKWVSGLSNESFMCSKSRYFEADLMEMNREKLTHPSFTNLAFSYFCLLESTFSSPQTHAHKHT